VGATVLLIGFTLLVTAAIVAQGGHDNLWRYSHDDRHRFTGDRYVADVAIDYAKLHMPTVMATIEWTREFEAQPGKLLTVEIV
jgi:hypothetical protein